MEDLGHQPEVLGGLALSESDLSLMNLHQVRNQLVFTPEEKSSLPYSVFIYLKVFYL